MQMNGLTVKGSGVSFILFPVVLRKFLVQFHHMIIPECFSKYTCCCNGGIDRISFDNCLMRDPGVGRKSVSINQYKSGFIFQLIQRQVHGFDGGS